MLFYLINDETENSFAAEINSSILSLFTVTHFFHLLTPGWRRWRTLRIQLKLTIWACMKSFVENKIASSIKNINRQSVK